MVWEGALEGFAEDHLLLWPQLRKQLSFTDSGQQDMAKRGGLTGVGGSLSCLEQMGKVDRNFTHCRFCH